METIEFVPVTAIYAGLLALLYLAQCIRVTQRRGQTEIAIGDGGNAALIQAMRGQANAAEYIPLALILLALAELQGAPGIALHVLGLALLIGRVAHAVAFWGATVPMAPRAAGAILTWAMIGITALGLVAHALV